MVDSEEEDLAAAACSLAARRHLAGVALVAVAASVQSPEVLAVADLGRHHLGRSREALAEALGVAAVLVAAASVEGALLAARPKAD